MFPEALAELREATKLTDGLPLALASYGHALAASGDRRGALEVLAQLRETSKTKYVSGYDIALMHAALGDKDEAFRWLDHAAQERASLLPYITWDRRADNLRSDPRYDDLLRRLGLPPSSSKAGLQRAALRHRAATGF